MKFDPPYDPEPIPVTDSGPSVDPSADSTVEASAPVTPKGYWQSSRTATYGFLAALPLFVMYEALILFVNPSGPAQIRVGADLWLKQLMALFGGQGLFALGIPVLLIGIWIFIKDRKKRPPLRLKWFGWIIGESALYAVVVAILVSTIVGLIFAMGLAGPATQAADSLPTSMMMVLSIGAGLYEELVFRVVLVGGMFLIFRHFLPRVWVAYLAAAVIGALLFSAVHYMGSMGDAFTMASFTFRFLFGLALNGVFLARGFGVAAWTHALYDVFVVTQILG